MRKHTKIYMEAMNYTDTDFIPSEISGKPGVDVHHIIGRGKTGEDRIENLMVLTREEHVEYGDKKHHMVGLLFKHESFLKSRGINYDHQWFIDNYKKYADNN